MVLLSRNGYILYIRFQQFLSYEHTERQASAGNTSQWWRFPSVDPNSFELLQLAAPCVHTLKDFLKTFEGFVYSWPQAINFFECMDKPLKGL